MTKCDKLDN